MYSLCLLSFVFFLVIIAFIICVMFDTTEGLFVTICITKLCEVLRDIILPSGPPCQSALMSLRYG